ncbi:MAG: 3-oxoacyl-ACP synthase [Armatimonadota bacterium]|nr:3-oxoacyl-ACP synthase [Armatimonadota bacterium]MDR5696516.1 3-oxoacyl-ACP synthase [Armatimonadota bacterium]
MSIVGISTYVPARVQTAAEIADRTGIPLEVVERKFGLRGKHIAAADEHVSDMAVKAAAPLVFEYGTDVGAVVYFGSAHKDYYLWSCAPKIQHALGLDRAFAFEVMATSACAPIALRLARDMLAADARLGSVLLVGASRESYVIDYRNHRSRFAFNFADGAAAALLRRGADGHRVLESAAVTDGSFADDVMVPAGGSVYPASHQTVERGMHALDVRDPQGMKERLDPVSLDRFVRVVREAVERSGFTSEDVAFIAPLHMKRSMHDALLAALGLEPQQATYLEGFGHMSAIDPLVGLAEASRAGRLRPGDLVVAVSAGTGYTWAATAIRW